MASCTILQYKFHYVSFPQPSSCKFRLPVKYESYLHNKAVPSIRSIALLLRNNTAGIFYGTVEGSYLVHLYGMITLYQEVTV